MKYLKSNLLNIFLFAASTALVCIFIFQRYSSLNMGLNTDLIAYFYIQPVYISIISIILFTICFLLLSEVNKRYKHIKNELFVSREELFKILLSVGDAVIVTNRDGTIASMNSVAEELTGWELSESKGRKIENIFDAVNEETLLPIENPLTVAIRNNKGTLLSNHTILKARNKIQFNIVESAVLIHNAASDVIGGALVFRDVTEISKNKRKLDESEGILKGILENSKLAITIKDISGKFKYINRNAEVAYNLLSTDKFGEKSTGNLTPKQIIESNKIRLKVLKEKCLFEYDQEITNNNGGNYLYHISEFPLYNRKNQIYATCAIATDITKSDKKYSFDCSIAGENKAILSENRQLDLMKNMPNLFIVLDQSSRLIYSNNAFYTKTDTNAEKVLGRDISETFPSFELSIHSNYHEVMKTGNQISFICFPNFRENHSAYIVSIFPISIGVSIIMTNMSIPYENIPLSVNQLIHHNNKSPNPSQIDNHTFVLNSGVTDSLDLGFKSNVEQDNLIITLASHDQAKNISISEDHFSRIVSFSNLSKSSEIKNEFFNSEF